MFYKGVLINLLKGVDLFLPDPWKEYLKNIFKGLEKWLERDNIERLYLERYANLRVRRFWLVHLVISWLISYSFLKGVDLISNEPFFSSGFVKLSILKQSLFFIMLLILALIFIPPLKYSYFISDNYTVRNYQNNFDHLKSYVVSNFKPYVSYSILIVILLLYLIFNGILDVKFLDKNLSNIPNFKHFFLFVTLITVLKNLLQK